MVGCRRGRMGHVGVWPTRCCLMSLPHWRSPHSAACLLTLAGQHLNDESGAAGRADSGRMDAGTKVRRARGGRQSGSGKSQLARHNRRRTAACALSLQEATMPWYTLGVRPELQVITYCHSHHRSAHAWLMLIARLPTGARLCGLLVEWATIPTLQSPHARLHDCHFAPSMVSPTPDEGKAVLSYLSTKSGITPRTHSITGADRTLSEIYVIG